MKLTTMFSLFATGQSAAHSALYSKYFRMIHNHNWSVASLAIWLATMTAIASSDLHLNSRLPVSPLLFLRDSYCCDRKPRRGGAASAQSFTLWQQTTTIEITRRDYSKLLVRYNIWVLFLGLIPFVVNRTFNTAL